MSLTDSQPLGVGGACSSTGVPAPSSRSDEESSCCVCLNCTDCLTPCLHRLCADCHYNLRKNFCPMCRRPLPEEGAGSQSMESDDDSSDDLPMTHQAALRTDRRMESDEDSEDELPMTRQNGDGHHRPSQANLHLRRLMVEEMLGQ
mmetsp:Transcript_47877/g.87712  ORF Transcript_47877/g.87712 Transcript_47877/m.87712 type:complete len:146 (-) Transcript_47877:47-484(-)